MLTDDSDIQLSKGSIKSLNFDDILYFEASSNTPHYIVVLTENSSHVFRGNLKDIHKKLDERFVKCNRATIVSVEKSSQLTLARWC